MTPAPKKPFKPNGCGAEGSILNPPDLIFEPACREHDSLYWVGGDPRKRFSADSIFYVRMIGRVKKAKWYTRPFYAAAAKVYHLAVRIGGEKSFEKGDPK